MAWKELNKKKWELRHDNQVLATIYEKSKDRYSVYIAVPLIFQKVRDILGKTYIFKSFDEAERQCYKMLRERVLDWSKAIVSYCEPKIIDGRTDRENSVLFKQDRLA